MVSDYDRGVTLRSSPRKSKTTSFSSSATVQPFDRYVGPKQQDLSHSKDMVMYRGQQTRGWQKPFPATHKLALILLSAWFCSMFSSFRNQFSDPVPPYYLQKTSPANFRRLRRRRKVSIPSRRLPLAIRILQDDLSSVETLHHTPNVTYPIHRGVAFTHYESTHYNPADALPEEGCTLQGAWQVSFYPTCSLFHEVDLTQPAFGFRHLHGTRKEESKRLIGSGSYRDTWMVRQYNDEKAALKTLRDGRHRVDDERNFERHRKDAMAMEQLTASPFVADIYGHCYNSVLMEYANGGGGLNDILHTKNNMTPLELLQIGHDLAASVADAHHFTADGYATMAHTDLNSNNWIRVNNKYKLNDFNRGKFLTLDTKNHGKYCPFFFEKNQGPWRSPEEYNYEPETYKIDVFALGNVLHYLLVPFEGEYWPGDDFNDWKAWMKRVADGRVAEMDDAIRNRTDSYTRAMVKAIDMALVPDPDKRATAHEVRDVMKAALPSVGS